eukprot:CAMPEP_0172165092 /NCGR_PEP_ID=MMETSP1050-20130122/8221_1 /TAXON_ID=233186 /ORGANISM="Cryptomonas curvata, Strain CCAP979/52" /LENGTH=300 /DNA_ID=CAMNT_0012835527 /DNA_START=202 /DNA_END=1100 /DNA_ORIENTATION=+
MSRYEDVAIVDRIADLIKPPDSSAVELALDDPSVIEASEILRHYINNYRSENCSSLNQYSQPGIIKYAKRAVLDQYAVLYSIEVAFGDEAIFSRFRLLPYNAFNLSERRLEFLSSTPAPCSTRIQEQLAVSALAVEEINNQNLSWVASYNPQYEGLLVKQFGLGNSPQSTGRRQAEFLLDQSSGIDLTTSEQESSQTSFPSSTAATSLTFSPPSSAIPAASATGPASWPQSTGAPEPAPESSASSAAASSAIEPSLLAGTASQQPSASPTTTPAEAPATTTPAPTSTPAQAPATTTPAPT